MGILTRFIDVGRKLLTEEVDKNWTEIEKRFKIIETPGSLLFKKPGNLLIDNVQPGDVRTFFTEGLIFCFQVWNGSSWELVSNIPKSKLTITGLTTIDWVEGFATDKTGASTGITWRDTYGYTPVIQTWYNPGTDDYELIQLPVKLSGDDYIIDATGLEDVIVIIS